MSARGQMIVALIGLVGAVGAAFIGAWWATSQQTYSWEQPAGAKEEKYILAGAKQRLVRICVDGGATAHFRITQPNNSYPRPITNCHTEDVVSIVASPSASRVTGTLTLLEK